MKKVFLVLALALLIVSCSLNDDDGQNIQYQFARITEVELPDTLEIGNSYTFYITSEESECSLFNNFEVQTVNDSTLTIGALNRILIQENCSTTKDTVIEKVGFNATNRYNLIDSFTFQFLQGADVNDEPIYLTRTIPLKQETN